MKIVWIIAQFSILPYVDTTRDGDRDIRQIPGEIKTEAALLAPPAPSVQKDSEGLRWWYPEK